MMARKRTIFDEYCDLKVERIQTGQEMPERFRELFYRALQETAKGISQLHPEMALEIAFAFRDILSGTPNALLSPVPQSKGKSGRTPTEASCIEDAVRYRRAESSGIIKDKHPIKTIQEAFGGSNPMTGGVSSSTVNKWIKDPRFKSIKPEDLDKDLLAPMLKLSGAHYQRMYTKKSRQKLK